MTNRKKHSECFGCSPRKLSQVLLILLFQLFFVRRSGAAGSLLSPADRNRRPARHSVEDKEFSAGKLFKHHFHLVLTTGSGSAKCCLPLLHVTLFVCPSSHTQTHTLVLFSRGDHLMYCLLHHTSQCHDKSVHGVSRVNITWCKHQQLVVLLSWLHVQEACLRGAWSQTPAHQCVSPPVSFVASPHHQHPARGIGLLLLSSS